MGARHWYQSINFQDPTAYEKTKFVYTKNKASVEVMRSFFDVENLPRDFGGKATLTYNHEEFSKQMVEEDVKTANFWGIDKKIINTSGAAVQQSRKPWHLIKF
ncbi:CRAL-TRIO domain-containing protein C23B6.04c isoform X2 [Tripterygium wilfordii]|uniref:CRAL-TRIO domain-containing protein C23B6.04c isoform X2 n=1 Tax=Tripterygium wilfordii TaxID=458696 RepID=A0A7J7E365_TRIWF|nr:CRAL-TRIO domain-containing protein C23B6.04c isoform X2 [Tripterygium wilfordii]